MYGIGFGIGAIGATTKSSGGGVAYDSDAQAFFTASGITDLTQKSAINQFYIDLKSYGLFSKAYSIQCLFLGNSTRNSINLINPSLYTHSYSSGYTFNSASAIPNGSSSYIDTNLNSQTVMDLNNNSIGIYSQVDNTYSAVDVGASNGSNIHFDIELFYGGLYSSNNSSYSTNVTTRTDGFFLNTRTVFSGWKIYRNGSVIVNGGLSSVSELNFNHYLNARNSNNSATFFSNRPLSLFWAGQGLTDTEAINLNTCVNTLMTTLGINV